MGLQHDDEEQQLPLAKNDELDSPDQPPVYSEATQFIPSDTSLSPPEPKATPDEVRDFIITVLTQSRGLGLDHARRVAARWSMGTGEELRKYPVAMFREIFGAEDGWAVYKEVRVQYYKKENEKEKEKRTRPQFLAGLAVWFLLVIGAIVVLVSDVSEGWKVVSFIFVLFGGIFGLGGLCAALHSDDPGKRAERELMSDWTKPRPTDT